MSLAKIEKFSQRNIAVWYPEWYENPEKKSIEYLIDCLKWQVWALLTFDDIKQGKYFLSGKWKITLTPDIWNHPYSLLSEKDVVISKAITQIIQEIISYGSLTSAQYRTPYYYSLLSPETLRKTVDTYFQARWKELLALANTPLYLNNNEIITYQRDLDHDFSSLWKGIIIYCIENDVFTSKELENINQLLHKGWDTLEYFTKANRIENLLENYIKNYVFKTKLEIFHDAFHL